MSAGGAPIGFELVLREVAPRVLGAVARRAGDFAAAEDAVQEALIAAHVSWPTEGTPANPGGWLYRVACRRLADQRDGETARRERELVAGAREATERAERAPVDNDVDEQDDTLALFFTCCHPALTESSAIALTLRAVGGLTTNEIGRAFLVPEATMAQRISRAKQAIASSGLPLEMPDASERAARLEAVMHVLYLVFNEGYAASAGPELVRVELSSEAIRLARALQRAEPLNPEVSGLLALMLLTDARRSARTGPAGELIPLEEQDRARWNRDAIAEGTALIGATLARGAVGAYQLQAAIAALHDEAASVATTDWAQILALYGLLQRVRDNPMVALNRAVAAAMVHGPKSGLRMLDALDGDPRMRGHQRLAAARAHLMELDGDSEAAILHYRLAANATENEAERRYLTTKAERLERERRAGGSRAD